MKNLLWLLLALVLSPTAILAQASEGHTRAGVLSAAANQSAPATYDGIAHAVAACPVSGCVVQIESNYPVNAESPYPYGTAFTPTGPNQRFVDTRAGGDRQLANDVGLATTFGGYTSFGRTCLTHFNVIGDCLNVTHRLTAPGINNGTNPPGTAGQDLWTVSHGLWVDVNCQGQGICGGIGVSLNHQGLGDTNNYRYVTTWGGNREGAGEFTQGDASHVVESGTFYTGTIAGVSSFTVRTTPTGGTVNDLGVGQRLVETTAANLLATGYVTSCSASALVDANGVSYEVCGISSTVTPSKWWGTLDADIANIPTIQSTGTNAICTSTSWSAHTAGGASTPAVGDLVNLAGNYMEAAQLTSVSAGSAGHYNLTACLRKNHNAGSLLMDTPWARGGFEFTANTVNGFRYDLDALGATDASHVVMVQYFQGGISPFNFANVSLNQFSFADASLSSSGGVVTIPFYPRDLSQQYYLQSYPLITISGATNPAFNGPCLNLHQISTGPFVSKAQCTKAGIPDGTSDQSGYVTLGDTGFGNGRFNLRPLAEVVDIQTYAAGAAPTVTGNLRLEPNAMPLPVGGTVALDHDYAMSITGRFLYMNHSNPYCLNCTGDQVAMYGFDGTSPTGITYNTPFNWFGGLGGKLAPPPGPAWVRGVASGIGGMDTAPWPAGASLFSVGCPPSALGCADTMYFYDPIHGMGVGRTDAAHFYPGTNSIVWDYLHHFFLNVPAGTGTLSDACLDSGGQLVQCAPKPWSCQPSLGGGPAAIPAGSYQQAICFNDTGQTVTLTGVRCYANAGSSTLSVANGSGTALLTAAIACSTGFAAGTQSATTTLAPNDFLAFTFTADGMTGQATFVVSGSHP